MIQGWKKLRYRLEFAGVSLLAFLVPRLPRRACHRLAGWVGSLAFLLDRRGRAVALANLEHAFGSEYSPEARRRIAQGSYRTFVRTMFDLFWAPRLNTGNFRDYIEVENEAAVSGCAREGAIFIFSHAGNFEWSHMSIGFICAPGMGVAEDFKNPLLSDLFTRLRAAAGTKVVPQERSILRLFKYLKGRGIVGMLIDLNLRPDQPSVVIESFGLKTCVPQIHLALHQRTGTPIYPVFPVPLAGGRYQMRIGEPLRFPAQTPVPQMAQACWEPFERFIRENPELWMWSYKHWRYRPEGAERAYPFYANVSAKFEKLLRSQALTKTAQ